MEPEKFENNVKKLLGEREIQPSANSWEKLERRLEQNRKNRPYLLWMSSAAAIAAIFFVLGTYFNAPIASEEPQLVEQTPEEPIFEEKTSKPEVIQVAASEEKEQQKEEKKSSAERGVEKGIFEAPLRKSSGGETEVAAQVSSEVETGSVIENKEAFNQPTAAIAQNQDASKNVDLEVEALLLLATAELKPDVTYHVNSNDLLDQVENELNQSFREKVFEVVKDGLNKAKSAVATRDLKFN